MSLRSFLSGGLILSLVACQPAPPASPAPDLRASPRDMSSPADMVPQEEDSCPGVPATGRCVDETMVQMCKTDPSGSTGIVSMRCGASARCVSDAMGSYCKSTSECIDGDGKCDGNSLWSCQAGRWQRMDCGAKQCMAFPGFGAECNTPATAVTVKGRLRYQYMKPRADFRGMEGPVLGDAAGMMVAVAEGGTMVGSGVTSATGAFSFQTWRTPGPTAQLMFVTMRMDGQGRMPLGVARLAGPESYRTSAGFWSFSVPTLPAPMAGAIDVGTQVVNAPDSGAIHVFEWMIFETERVKALLGRAPAQSLAVLWSPTVDASCGACYLLRAFGGTDIQAAHFDVTILLSGTPENPSHWSTSVLTHEYGHFMMNEYSRTPNEGGVHFINQASKPGLAYSEGWATFSGQAAVSDRLGAQSPVYYDTQDGTTFFVDLTQLASSAGQIPLPDPAGALNQMVSENVVAGIMWDLWKLKGDGPLHRALIAPRVTSALNRGYMTVDLVDYADALSCDGLATADQLTASMRTRFRFPWDNKPLCP